MKHLHTKVVDNLTYIVLNKQKIDNKQTPMAHHRRVAPWWFKNTSPMELASQKKEEFLTMHVGKIQTMKVRNNELPFTSM